MDRIADIIVLFLKKFYVTHLVGKIVHAQFHFREETNPILLLMISRINLIFLKALDLLIGYDRCIKIFEFMIQNKGML